MADEADQAPAEDAVTNDAQEAAKAPEEEPLGEAGLSALRSERAARKEADAKLKAAEARLKSIEDSGKSELEKATERAQALEAEITSLKLDSARKAAIAQFNLSEDAAEFLNGDDEDSILASAEKLAGIFPNRPRGPVVSTEGKQPSEAPLDNAHAFANFAEQMLHNQ
jgi:hypothetical protein